MNVNAAGSDPTGLDPLVIRALVNVAYTAPLSALSSRPESAHDGVSSSLRELTLPAIQHLLDQVENRLSSAGLQHVESSHRLSHPAIDGIDAQSLQTLEARDSAEKSVAKAVHAIETGGGHTHSVPSNLDPRAVIAIAEHFIGTGQLPCYLRATELGQLVASWYERPLLTPTGPGVKPLLSHTPRFRRPDRFLRRFTDVLWNLSRRAPMLGLLTAWMAIGIFAIFLTVLANAGREATASTFEIWGVGFLTLVVFQFAVTVRGALWPKSRHGKTSTKIDSGTS